MYTGNRPRRSSTKLLLRASEPPLPAATVAGARYVWAIIYLHGGILHEGILHGGHVRLLTSALDPLLGIRKLAGWPVQQLHSF